MADLLSTHDYRDYLKQVFEERKQTNPLFSYRLWARQLGLDAAQLYRILGKGMHLPLRHLDAVISNLRLRKVDAESFRLLVELGRARTEKQRNLLVQRLLALRDVRCNTLTREQYMFFREWYHTTVRCLIGAGDGSAASLQKAAGQVIPALTARQVQSSVDLQQQLGLLRKEKGRWVLGEAHLSTDEKEVHKAIRGYQAEMLRLGGDALERFPKQERDFSTLTFAVDSQTALDISGILAECRRQIQRRIEDSGTPDRVLHLSMSMFPTALFPVETRILGGEK